MKYEILFTVIFNINIYNNYNIHYLFAINIYITNILNY